MVPDNTNRHGPAALQAEQVDPQDTVRILEKHGRKRSALIAILGDIQAKYRYLPQDALRTVAEETGASLVDVYATATFYRSFSLKPKGKHIVLCCLGTACHVRGAPRILEELQRHLGIGAGETTPDMQFTLETVNCLGACALGPIVVANGRYFSNVTPAKVGRILRWARSGSQEASEGDSHITFPVAVSCPHCRCSLMGPETAGSHQRIHLMAACADARVPVSLSCLYGTCAVQSEHEIPVGATVDLICPHCDARLLGTGACIECEGPMARMAVNGGGSFAVCLRFGCDGQTLDLDGREDTGVEA